MQPSNTFSEQIERARHASLSDYFIRNGYDVERSKNELHVKGYGGLYVNIETNEWYCFSQPDKKGGRNAVDCLTDILGFDFRTAVEQLSEINPIYYVHQPFQQLPQKKKELLLPEHAENNGRVISYLCNQRYIDRKLIEQLINEKLLYQDKRGNAVFLHKNEIGENIGAELQGTDTSRRYKGVAAGTHDSLFSLKIGNPTKAYIFESAIDLLSFRQMANPQKLQNSTLVSMAGLKPDSLKRLKEQNLKLYACVDNDEAGRKFISDNNLTACNNVLSEHDVKDFNELLQRVMKNREIKQKTRNIHKR